jgi:hypothetical protein
MILFGKQDILTQHELKIDYSLISQLYPEKECTRLKAICIQATP